MSKHKVTQWALGHIVLPIAQASGVEGRLRAILLPKRRQTMMTRKTVAMVAMAALGVLLPLASLRITVRAQTPPRPATPHPKIRMTQANAAISAVSTVPGEVDAQRLLAQGGALSPGAAGELVRRLALDPDDLTTRIELIGYYGASQYHSADAAKSLYTQIFWMIRHHPESVIMGQSETLILKRAASADFNTAEGLWLAQVSRQPKNTVILGNAAEFCLLSDVPTAERLLKQAAAADPRSPLWPDKLGELYQLQVRLTSPPAGQRYWAQKALTEFQTAAAQDWAQAGAQGDFEKMSLAAYDAGKYDLASRYANNLLADTQLPGNYDVSGSTHHADMILGLLALRDNDQALAEHYLQAMGQISGSPSLDTFGPNMRLAQALLERGDRQPVLDYLAECAKFWSYDNGQLLKTWTAQIHQGKMPNFSANLYY